MAHWQQVLVILCSVCFACLLAAPSRSRESASSSAESNPLLSHKARLCGTKLIKMITRICEVTQRRRSSSAVLPRAKRVVRAKRGITERCCRRKCRLSTLRRHCSISSPTFTLALNVTASR